jgi:hypothetical protein
MSAQPSFKDACQILIYKFFGLTYLFLFGVLLGTLPLVLLLSREGVALIERRLSLFILFIIFYLISAVILTDVSFQDTITLPREKQMSRLQANTLKNYFL